MDVIIFNFIYMVRWNSVGSKQPSFPCPNVGPGLCLFLYLYWEVKLTPGLSQFISSPATKWQFGKERDWAK